MKTNTSLEQKRLQIRRMIMMEHTEQMQLAQTRLSNTHLDTDELLVVELKRYEQMMQTFSQAYRAANNLSDTEVELICTKDAQPNQVVSSCLMLDEQKKHSSTQRFLSLTKFFRPFLFLAQYLPTNRSKNSFKKQFYSGEER